MKSVWYNIHRLPCIWSKVQYDKSHDGGHSSTDSQPFIVSINVYHVILCSVLTGLPSVKDLSTAVFTFSRQARPRQHRDTMASNEDCCSPVKKVGSVVQTVKKYAKRVKDVQEKLASISQGKSWILFYSHPLANHGVRSLSVLWYDWLNLNIHLRFFNDLAFPLLGDVRYSSAAMSWLTQNVYVRVFTQWWQRGWKTLPGEGKRLYLLADSGAKTYFTR